MRRVSINARTAHDAATTDEIEVALFMVEHPSLAAPIRLSTDPTERISMDPISYGTRSGWMGANTATDPYLFVLLSTDLPSDLEDAPAASSLILQNVDNRIGEMLRSFTDRATIHMAVVFASTPDLVEAEFRDMAIISSEGTADQVTLQISREPIEEENVPMDRFTKDRFPGMFR